MITLSRALIADPVMRLMQEYLWGNVWLGADMGFVGQASNHFAQPIVNEHHVTSTVQQHVLRLDISVDDAVLK